MAENVGSIYYTVEADVMPLVEAEKRVDKSLDRMGKNLATTDKSANDATFAVTKTSKAIQNLGKDSDGAQRSLGGLTKLLGGLLSLQGVTSLIQMAEAYNEMAERVQMATSSTEEFNNVQARLLETSNKTYRSLSEAQELFVRTSAALKAMGYDTDAALDVTDSLSYAFVKNATSVDRAGRATDAFSKVLNKGKVEADAWETILAAIPTIIDDIAASSGLSAQAVRQLGVAGDLTARQMSEGLRQSLESNRKAADGMATTMRDAFTALRNNLSALVGEANRSSGATGLLSAAILGLANNLETVVNVLLVAGAGALAKYLASLTASTVASARAALGARAQAAAALAVAQANEASALAAAGHAAAQVRLGGSLAASTAAAAAHRAAMAATATAQAAAATSGAGLLAVLGGPAGIIGLVAAAAAGFVLFGTNAKNAAPNVEDLARAVDDLNEAQLALRRNQVGDAIQQVEKEARDSARMVAQLTRDIDALTAARARGANIDGEGMSNANKSLVEEKANLDEVTTKLEKLRALEEKLANQKPREKSSGAPSGPKAADPDVAKRLQGMRDEVALLKLTGDARARLQAIQKLGANATPEEAKEAQNLASQIYALEQAQKASTDAGKKFKEANEENQKVIAQLATELYQAGLSGEALATAKARASLNEFATPEQVQQVEALAASLNKVNEAQANKKLLAQVDPIAAAKMQYEQELADQVKLLEAKQINEERFLELKAQTEKAYDERSRVLQEENFRRQSSWNELLMSSLDQLGAAATDTLVGIATGATSGQDAIKALAGAILKQGVAALVQMGLQYVKNLIMGQSAQAAATAAGVTMATTLATAYAVPAALASLMSFGANSAPAMAGIAATVGLAEGLAIVGGGGRLYGGPVDASKMYRINENGAPEVFNAANGQQFMLPNQRGEVISNNNAQAAGRGAGAPGVTVNLIEDRDRAGQVSQTDDDGAISVDIFVADIQGGGEMSQALQNTYGLTRQGR